MLQLRPIDMEFNSTQCNIGNHNRTRLTGVDTVVVVSVIEFKEQGTTSPFAKYKRSWKPRESSTGFALLPTDISRGSLQVTSCRLLLPNTLPQKRIVNITKAQLPRDLIDANS